MSDEKSFFQKVLDFLGGGGGSTKQIPDSGDFLSKYSSLESSGKVTRKEETPVNPPLRHQPPEQEPELQQQRDFELPQEEDVQDYREEYVPTFDQTVNTVTGASKFCPYCGSRNPAEYRFCNNCGKQNPLTTGYTDETVDDTGEEQPFEQPAAQFSEPEPKKRKGMATTIFLVIFLLTILGVGGWEGYYWYKNSYIKENSFDKAQRALQEGKWTMAANYLSETRDSYIANPSPASDVQLAAINVWLPALDKIRRSSDTLNSKVNNIFTITDYQSCLMQVEQINWQELNATAIGSVNVQDVVKPVTLLEDSVRLMALDYFLRNTAQFHKDSVNVIHENGTGAAINLQNELNKILNKNEAVLATLQARIMQSMVPAGADVAAAVPADTVAVASAVVTTPTPHATVIPAPVQTQPVTPAAPPVNKSRKPQTPKPERNYD